MTRGKKLKTNNGTNALKKGKSEGTEFDKWMKQNGLRLKKPELPDDVGFTEELQANIEYVNKRKKYLEGMIEYYKSINTRAGNLQQMVMSIETDLLDLRRRADENDENVLENKAYRDALKQKHKIIKDLNRLDFDKQKAAAELSMKKAREKDEDGDLFSIDAEAQKKMREEDE